MRFQYELAERLGRTRHELLHGSGAYAPISSAEMTYWQAVWKLRAWEEQEAYKRSRR